MAPDLTPDEEAEAIALLGIIWGWCQQYRQLRLFVAFLPTEPADQVERAVVRLKGILHLD